MAGTILMKLGTYAFFYEKIVLLKFGVDWNIISGTSGAKMVVLLLFFQILVVFELLLLLWIKIHNSNLHNSKL